LYLRGLSTLYFRFPQNVKEQHLLNSRYPMQKVTVARTAKFPLVNVVTELQRLRHFCHFCAAPSMRKWLKHETQGTRSYSGTGYSSVP